MSLTSPLEQLGYPLFFAVDEDLDAPTPSLESAQRTRVRHLQGMQKEAMITDSRTGTTWRLASDEGDYLDGDDVAPCPLAFMTTGMVASYSNAIREVAAERGITVQDLELVHDNYYTMTGSALRGDMTGGALNPEIQIRLETDADEPTVESLVSAAVDRSPATGLLHGELENAFSLSLNGERIETGRVADLDGEMLDAPAATFDSIPRDHDEQDPPLGRNTGRLTEAFTGDRSKYTSGESSSLASEQDRVLHLRGRGTLAEDGLTSVEVKLYSPQGSIFELLSDEPVGHGGDGRAPGAASYLAAGIGFCFMTQFGRYADIVDKELSDYAIVQDTHFGEGEAVPVETHVFLESPEGDSFARDVLDMAEQTCFLHALCRTDLEPEVTLTAG